MTKNDTKLILQAFDELDDLLSDILNQYNRDYIVWDGIASARIHVLRGRETLIVLFKQLLLEDD